MASDLGQIAQLLEATLDPTKHRKGMQPNFHVINYIAGPLVNRVFLIVAEAALKAEEKNPQYSLQLLKIVATDSLQPNIRLASALCFKNFIRHNYVVCAMWRAKYPLYTLLFLGSICH